MNRGDIYYIARDDHEVGSEQHDGRPAVIVSNNKNNECSGTVEIVYMTTQPKTNMPTHVRIQNARKPSTVLCEQIHTVSKDRVGDKLGKVTEKEMTAIDGALMVSLELSTPAAEVLATTFSEMVRAQAERDVYKNLYDNLIDTFVKGARE